MKRIRPVNVLLVALIVILGYSLATRQRREARLRAVLAVYQKRATDHIARIMGRSFTMDWPDDTTLGEAIEQIQARPAGLLGFPKGLPVLVDPDGLREAGQSLGTPVKAPPPDDPSNGKWLSLRQKLRIVLEPLGLAAEARDGAIVITSRGRVDQAAASDEE
jgi:hypothetical protein